MASGFGAMGGQGRCFTFWRDFEECVSVAPHAEQCLDFQFDYIECLHRQRANGMYKQMVEDMRQNEEKSDKDVSLFGFFTKSSAENGAKAEH
eukprot:CAMPEP_0177635046 /NCGR_PEP_ID=MMETSP0447-20121125/3691_1 /TAXON_ID=0 /ORGANISM="Stygamoeba regulata, Strain BSH-02190019" /LENGTH=91 /DNA_ID=CAMNT_0019136805 /DNA_START=13 /DNA_END=288 /DNA_ORIENTATION=+